VDKTFISYRHSFPIGQLNPLDSYITSDPFAPGSLIALMMEAARTSETSVDIQLRTRQYIPEDSERNIKLHRNPLYSSKVLFLFSGAGVYRIALHTRW
jgi:hypothetical protein